MNVSSSNERPLVKPRFHQFDCVVLKIDIKGTSLKKGDVGAIMDVYENTQGNLYDVDFTEKRELECVPERALKLDFRLEQKKGLTIHSKDNLVPPAMPDCSMRENDI